MAEDWDLWAVVRSCYTPAAATATTTTTTTTTTTNYVTPQEYPIPVSPPLVFEQNDNSFGRRNSGFEELHEVYRTFFANSQPIINPLLGGFNHQKPPQPINPNSNPTSSVSFLGGFCHQQEPQPMNPNIIIPTTPSSNSVLGGFKFNDQPEQEPKPELLNPNKQKTHFMNPNIMVAEEEEQKPQPPQPINPNIMDMSSVSVLGGFNGKEDEAEEQKPQPINPNMTSKKQQCRKHTQPQPQPPPPKPNIPEQCGYQYQRKKSQRTAVVEVEAENLPEVDPWNWRKYGRKPIKTSPYPRNYYKCSSEGNKCQAKKYVEKSPEDPEKFMVSYCGEHDHSPPRRRNALSCTSRKKSSTTTKKENDDAVKMEEADEEDEEDVLNSENVFMGLQDLDKGGESGTSANDFDRSWSVNDDFSFSGPVVSMGF